MLRCLLRALVVCWAVVSQLPAAEVSIPPVPAINGSGEFVQDFASLLMPAPAEMRARVFRAQQTAMEDHNTPIILVTIHRMAAFGYSGEEIQPFAQQWFNKWQIGTLNNSAGGHNRGILLLVSVGDRKGRIELGADWGTRFDGTCRQIMDNVMIPHFKRGNYTAGIAAGVEALGKMATVGPGGDSESLGFGSARTRRGSGSGLLRYSFFPKAIFFILIAAGLGLIVLGLYTGSGPDASAGKKKIRFWLILAGVTMIVTSFFTFLLVFLFLWLFFCLPLKLLELLISLLGFRVRFFSGGSSSGGSYSGGGYSGGYSGGGGASGSW